MRERERNTQSPLALGRYLDLETRRRLGTLEQPPLLVKEIQPGRMSWHNVKTKKKTVRNTLSTLKSYIRLYIVYTYFFQHFQPGVVSFVPFLNGTIEINAYVVRVDRKIIKEENVW